jgi:ubiquinone/menaquinone biosynthesis C-methylase UbiE
MWIPPEKSRCHQQGTRGGKHRDSRVFKDANSAAAHGQKKFVNAFETWVCGSSLWRYVTRRQLLPWVLRGSDLGDHLLELGAGPGAATEELQRRTARVTSLEYDHTFAAKLRARASGTNAAVLQGDAATLPFPDQIFSSAIAIFMLHHLKSPELQNYAVSEIFRVLRPGGVFLAIEIQDSWLNRVAHLRSTFVPVSPASASARLTLAGFSSVTFNFRRGGFRIKALRPAA